MKKLLVVLVLLCVAGCSSSEKPSPAAPATPSAKPADEQAALRVISEITRAQAEYFRRNRRYALVLDELVEAHTLQAEALSNPTGYDFKLRPSADAQTYRLVVNPLNGSPTTRYFFSDQKGEIHAEQGKEAGPASPPVADNHG